MVPEVVGDSLLHWLLGTLDCTVTRLEEYGRKVTVPQYDHRSVVASVTVA
jgi:hypothetical protein